MARVKQPRPLSAEAVVVEDRSFYTHEWKELRVHSLKRIFRVAGSGLDGRPPLS